MMLRRAPAGTMTANPGLILMLNAIKHRLAFAFFYPEELIEVVAPPHRYLHRA